MSSTSQTNVPTNLDAAAAPDLLTPARERQLLARAQQGDAEALAELHLCFEPLVCRQAKHIAGRPHDEDLLQAGHVGLQEAIQRFDLQRGTRLSTLARCWVQRRMQEELARRAVVAMPERAYREMLRRPAEAGGEAGLPTACSLDRVQEAGLGPAEQPEPADVDAARDYICEVAAALQGNLHHRPSARQVAQSMGLDLPLIEAALRGQVAAARAVLAAAGQTPPVGEGSPRELKPHQPGRGVQLSFSGWFGVA